MGMLDLAIRAAETTPIPDGLTRAGIGWLVKTTSRSLAGAPPRDADFARAMSALPVATETAAANAQHYELPPRFFELTLGPRRKYSSCLYPTGSETLAEAEIFALRETADHADLSDGQAILELGCGWGSLSLYMAERFPASTIVAVSNSNNQRLFIEHQIKARGLTNLKIVTADMNTFQPPATFDRIVSIEMFEHMANWRALFHRMRHWLRPEGRIFLHVFTHASQPYRFDSTNKIDWMAQHFFAGGMMPSHRLLSQFEDCVAIEQEWRWSGTRYERTANDWLANFDANQAEIDDILAEVYGRDARLWRRRWRLFYLTTAELFGHANGDEWGVSHYRLRPV